jgi:HK97 family phage portal protein
VTALGRVAAASSTITFRATDEFAVEAFNAGGRTASGISINASSAMRISAVYGAVSIIAETTAALPLHMYESLGDQGKRLAPEHPLDEKLHDQPNDYQTAIEFREMMTAFALLRGMGIAESRKRRGGRDFDLIPLHPDCLSRDFTRSGVERFRYADPHTGETRILLADELFIVRGRFGRSVIDFARDSLGLARQMDIYASNLFARGARPSGVLTHQKLLSPKARTNLRKALNEYSAGGDNAGRPMLLEEGMTWTQMQISNKDAEFLESRKFSVAEIARWFRVPPHKLQDLERATNNNIEMQSMEFVVDTMVPWCERWEQSIRRDLIIDRRFFAEHVLAGLLRGDTKSRYEAYALAIQFGWMSPNEARRLENLNPYAGGDLFQRPLNMEPITGGGRGPGAIAYLDGHSGRVISLADTTRGYLRALVRSAVTRAVRKEAGSIAKLAERTGASGSEWREGVQAFYREHAEFVATLLHLPDEAAQQYAVARAERVLEIGTDALANDSGSIDELSTLSLERADVLRLPAAA